MISLKLIFRNVHKNVREYFIYFLTLMFSVSLFYAFNSISAQPALSNLGVTRKVLYEQLVILISALSIVIAVVLAFLIIYANQFLLKRRKKELGIYMLLGMKKGQISRLFAGETLCIGSIALAVGLVLGFAISQGVSLAALRLFAVELDKFQVVFSAKALFMTALCFAIIFLIVLLFNVWSVTNVELIDLIRADRKNEMMKSGKPVLTACLFILSIIGIGASAILFNKNGILPTKGNFSFQIAVTSLTVGTFLLFFTLSTVLIRLSKANKVFYLRGLNTFLVQQIASKIRTNYLIVTIVCGLLTVTICTVSIGASTALTMNQLAKEAAPYDLNVVSNISVDGDGDIAAYLAKKGAGLDKYAEKMEQISSYETDLTYGKFFEGQRVELWQIDEELPEQMIDAFALSDVNKALKMQGKKPLTLKEDQYLINCNYKGTYAYIDTALKMHPEVTINGQVLHRASDEVMQDTFIMTSIGNNDRGTLIVPDKIANGLKKDMNALLVRYKPDVNSNEVLKKMIPIGLDKTHGYRYAEKNIMYEMYYGTNALMSFLCCYLGIIFLLICAALLALKQLTETTDNVSRYGLLQKLGAAKGDISRAIFVQTAVFFALPLMVAGIYSVFLTEKAMTVVEKFLNIHISTNIGLTVIMFLIIYGGYFLATYLSAKRMVTE